MATTEVIRRRNLPHWDMPHAAFFVTGCVEGSVPARGLLDLMNYRADLQRRPRPANKDEQEWVVDQWKLTFARAERWLDQEPAVRHLEDTRLARVVVDAFYHFAGQRYDLLAFVVMPSHYHWVFQPREEWLLRRRKADKRTPREEVVHSVNLFTATQCNKLLGRKGAFWQHECYDHWIRDVDELERIMLYVEGNPLKARLVSDPTEWLYSSAHDRKVHGLVFGEPLLWQ
jgi:type I restriction enzyme R subunit